MGAAAAAIPVVAGGIGAALGGKGGETSTPEMNDAQKAAANIAGGYYINSTGLQNAFYRDLSKVAGVPNVLGTDPNRFNPAYIQGYKSDYDVSKLPGYAPMFGVQKQSLESQYQQAKKNIMGSTPAGGNLTGALTNLEGQRATAVGNLPAELSYPIIQDSLNKAYGVAFNVPQQSVAGLSSVGNSYANLQAQTMAANAQSDLATSAMYGGLGTGLGRALGNKNKGG